MSGVMAHRVARSGKGWVVSDDNGASGYGIPHSAPAQPFPLKRDAEACLTIARGLVAGFVAATEKRYSPIENAVARLCWDVEYAHRDLVNNLQYVQEQTAADLRRLANGGEVFWDGSHLARAGAEVGVANAKFKSASRALQALMMVAEKAEPTGDVAVVLGVVRFFTGSRS